MSRSVSVSRMNGLIYQTDSRWQCHRLSLHQKGF